MKNITVAVVAVSAIAVAQPCYAGHFNPNQSHSASRQNVEIGNLFVNCNGINDGSATILNVPGKGFGVQLQITDPTCSENDYALAGIENLNRGQLFKYIRFTVTGLDSAPPPVANFGVDVIWTDSHNNRQSGFFTVANGGLSRQGNQFTLLTGNGHGRIAPGSTLVEVDFELDGNCVSAKQTAFVQNVVIDKTSVQYDLDASSAFCGGCS